MSAVMITTATLLFASPGSETQKEAATPYRLDHTTHTLVTLSALASIGLYEWLIEPELSSGLACQPPPGRSRCKATVLNELDRSVVGNNSRPWRDASNIGMYGTIGLALCGVGAEALLSDSPTPVGDLLTDALVISEAVTLAMTTTYLLKLLIQRPRPNHYTPGAPIKGFSQRLSFPSGHASTTAALATAFAMTFAWRHPNSMWRYLVYAGAATLAVFTSLSRVWGGRHFYTDALAGLAIGAVAGVAVPAWHHASTDFEPAVQLSPWFAAGVYGLAARGSF